MGSREALNERIDNENVSIYIVFSCRNFVRYSNSVFSSVGSREAFFVGLLIVSFLSIVNVFIVRSFYRSYVLSFVSFVDDHVSVSFVPIYLRSFTFVRLIVVVYTGTHESRVMHGFACFLSLIHMCR